MRTNQFTKETAAVNAGPKGRKAGRAPSAELLTGRGPEVARAQPHPLPRTRRRTPPLGAFSLTRCARREQLAIAAVLAPTCVRPRRWCHPALVLPDGFVWPIDDLVREARVRRDVVRCAASPFPLFPPSWCSSTRTVGARVTPRGAHHLEVAEVLGRRPRGAHQVGS